VTDSKVQEKYHHLDVVYNTLPNKQGLSLGGVLIAVTNECLSNEAKELKTNCEMVWAELTIANARKCQI
jgi:hypothetical protein